MILTCPDCASRYFVDDARVGPKGRSVRCAACGHSWRAAPQPNPFDAAPLPLTVAAGGAGASGSPSLDERTPLPKLIREEALEKKKTRQAVAAGAAWAVLGAGFLAVVLAAVLFKVDVVRLWPQTASAYAFARMPVNPTGLMIENVQGQPNLVNGHAALTVTGAERNVADGPRASIPLRIILFDKANHRLTSQVNAPPTRVIAPGESRPFAVNFIDPPSQLSNLVVEFAFDKTPPKAKAAAAPPALPKRSLQAARPLSPPPPAEPQPAARTALNGPAAAPLQVEQARPLPPNSPYALPPSAIQQSTN